MIKPENYELIYVGKMSKLSAEYSRLPTREDKLETIYGKFNINHPADYRGHSLSVSDIVVLHINGENSAHYEDSFGFTALPDFVRGLEKAVSQPSRPSLKARLTRSSMYVVTKNSSSSNSVESKIAEKKRQRKTPSPLEHYEKRKLLREQFEERLAEKEYLKDQMAEEMKEEELKKSVFSKERNADRFIQRYEANIMTS